ncbi:MAG TPA: RNase A-like domain-containing protein, partial [Roseiarcus sp.]|nr:RNase A-like domain-containing protein [Roseiarcus sp.]
TLDQIKQFQDYFDALMIGNLSRRRMLKFMPSDFKLQEPRQPPLKDQYDEWLARLVCYAFSVPVSPFVGTVNRATAETLRLQATQEGLAPMRAWVKDALDQVIQLFMGEDDLEFAWAGDDVTDPLQQAQTLQILVASGVKTVDEARADLGLAPLGKEPSHEVAAASAAIGKYNQYHDEIGRFSDAAGAVTTTAAAADNAPGKYSVDLKEEDGKYGGHTIAEHVGRTELELTQRIIDSIPPQGKVGYLLSHAGSFSSLEAANDFVNQVLQANKDEVDRVASGAQPAAWLEERFGYPTGKEAVATPTLSTYIRNTYNVGVWIVGDRRSPRGYRVQTAYPCNAKRTYPLISPD